MLKTYGRILRHHAGVVALLSFAIGLIGGLWLADRPPLDWQKWSTWGTWANVFVFMILTFVGITLPHRLVEEEKLRKVRPFAKHFLVELFRARWRLSKFKKIHAESGDKTFAQHYLNVDGPADLILRHESDLPSAVEIMKTVKSYYIENIKGFLSLEKLDKSENAQHIDRNLQKAIQLIDNIATEFAEEYELDLAPLSLEAEQICTAFHNAGNETNGS